MKGAYIASPAHRKCMLPFAVAMQMRDAKCSSCGEDLIVHGPSYDKALQTAPELLVACEKCGATDFVNTAIAGKPQIVSALQFSDDEKEAFRREGKMPPR